MLSVFEPIFDFNYWNRWLFDAISQQWLYATNTRFLCQKQHCLQVIVNEKALASLGCLSLSYSYILFDLLAFLSWLIASNVQVFFGMLLRLNLFFLLPLRASDAVSCSPKEKWEDKSPSVYNRLGTCKSNQTLYYYVWERWAPVCSFRWWPSGPQSLEQTRFQLEQSGNENCLVDCNGVKAFKVRYRSPDNCTCEGVQEMVTIFKVS